MTTEYARAIEDAAKCCEHANAGLVPPDGGSPTPREMLDNVAAAIRALSPAPQDDVRLALASALDRALTCWRDPEMRASAHFDAAMDELARLSTPADG